MRTLTGVVAILLLSVAARAQITFESLLVEMGDRGALARFPDPAYTGKQFSSYDRRSVTPASRDGWFANNDAGNFVRTETRAGRTEYVMADMQGPGAVVWIWSANPKGTLRIYLDRAPEPVIEYSMADLLGGKWTFERFVLGEPLAGIRGRGFNLYLPIPYARHCKITCDEGGFYYVVNYRTYEPGAQVQTLNELVPQTILHLAPLAEMGMERLYWPENIHPGGWHPDANGWKDLPPGESVVLNIREDGPGMLRTLGFAVRSPHPETAMRTSIVEILFDGVQTVWCPLSELSGNGIGHNPHRDVYRQVSEKQLSASLHWMMPFARSAEVRLWNFGEVPVHVGWQYHVGDWQWDDRSMHFYARWRHEHPISVHGGRGTADWNFVEVQGQGVYVGDTLSVMNPVAEWWGEGDKKIYVDGESFPSHFGTGTEDYYGYAWCSNQVFQHPFHSQTRCDGGEHGNNWGHSTVSRVRMLDAIPFERSLKMDMELWHWRECEVGYAAAVFFYARPGAMHNRPALPEEARKPIPQPPPLPPPFRIEGAIECEALKVVGRSEDLPVVVQDMRGFGAGKWSGEKHLWVQGRRAGDFVELEIPAEGRRAVTVHATRSWDYGVVRFSVNGEASPVGEVDLFSGSRGRCTPSGGALNLGTFTPDQGRLVLRAEVVRKSPNASPPGTFFGLDCVVLSPAPAHESTPTDR